MMSDLAICNCSLFQNISAAYLVFIRSAYLKQCRIILTCLHTHTHATVYRLLSGTTRVGRYEKKHSPTHTQPDHRTSFIIFLHLQRSTASSLFILRAWQSSQTISLQVLFGLPLGLGPSTYILHTFLHPIIIIFSQHMPIPTQPVLLQYQCCVIYT